MKKNRNPNPSDYPSQDQMALNIIINNLPAMVFYKDLEGVYVAANEMFCHQLNTTSKEIIGKTDYNFYPEEEAGKYRQTDLIVIATGEIFEGFQEEIDVDGAHRIYETRKVLLKDSNGKAYGIIGLAYDVTRQKMMEKELQSLANHNQAIIKAIPDLVFLFDKTGNYLDCYISKSKELLVPPEAFIGKNISDIFDQTVAEKTLDAIGKCLVTDTVQTFEYPVIQNATMQYFEARFIKVETDQALCISRNITERVNLQNELVLAKDLAEESSRLKSVLIKNITHELRTPLHGILGFSEILKHEITGPEHNEMAAHILDSGKRLMKTLNSIMMLSQLESGYNQLQTDHIDVNQELECIVGSFYSQVNEKGLYLKYKKNKSSHGFIDSNLFSQIISNILENAIKFTHQGGVAIHSKICKINSSRHLLMTITDTGIGISEANQKLIFEEFRQASEGNKRSFEGTGLGLTIAVKMVNLLAGKIELESSLGFGSEFKISLPFPDKQPA